MTRIFFDIENCVYREKGYIFPTIYHKNVELTDAYIEYYDHISGNNDRDYLLLKLVESYVGDDTRLLNYDNKNFNRVCTFEKNTSGEWTFAGFDREIFHKYPNITFKYLDIKDEYSEEIIG